MVASIVVTVLSSEAINNKLLLPSEAGNNNEAADTVVYVHATAPLEAARLYTEPSVEATNTESPSPESVGDACTIFDVAKFHTSAPELASNAVTE